MAGVPNALPSSNTHTQTTTLGADGSMSVVVENDSTGVVTVDETTTYVGGSKIFERGLDTGAMLAGADTVTEGNPANNADPDPTAQAIVTQADGSRLRFGRAVAASDTSPNDYMSYDPAVVVAFATNGTLPAADLALALSAYAKSTVNPMQHSAMGYGAWLDDSFFLAYRIYAENDALISDPDETAMKVVWGGRNLNATVARDLSGRGAEATWKGLMVGHDMDADSATANELLKGNASITARIGAATLADQASGSTTADLVDVSLTNIITGAGTAVARVADNGIQWTNLDLTGGYFDKGTEISGAFYDNGNEVVGGFNKMDITGAFGAVEYMEDTMTE